MDDTAWKMVLKGADGVVFVADSAPERMKANDDSLVALRKIMRGYGMSISDLPGVLQCNKRDTVNPLPLDKMAEVLNYGGFTVMPAVAGKGEGVLESLFTLMKGVLKNLRESGIVPGAEPEQPQVPEAAPLAVGKETPAIEPAPFAAEEEPPETEPVLLAAAEEAPTIAAPAELETETVPPAPAEPLVEAIPEPVIEIAGEAELLSMGRIRLPLKIRCGDTVKEVPLTINVELGLG
jgi:hypothetical protein